MAMRKRSPNYPAVSFPDALDRMRAIYKAEKTNAAPPEVLVQHIGYTSLNGRAKRVVAALKQFGLLESAGDLLHVSQAAEDIVLLEDVNPERVERIKRKLAFAPAVFEAINEAFSASLPSEGTLRHHLVRNLGFRPEASENLVQVYLATVQHLKPPDRDGSDSSGTQRTGLVDEAQVEVVASPTSEVASPPLGSPESEVIRIRLTRKCTAVLQFIGEVDDSAIDMLIRHMELSRSIYALDDLAGG